MSRAERTPPRRAMDREIARLAIPSLGALVAEPIFLATDTAMIGHLGATPLAALGLAGAVLQTVVGLMIFLAYATTPAVARRLGAGDGSGALRAGLDGVWLALGLGVVLGIAAATAAGPLLTLFGADPEVTRAATEYLRISACGLPGMLVTIAATGLFRGLQDARTPLVIATLGAIANVALNALLIYGAGWGLAGSAVGTAVAQTGMAIASVAIAVRAARAAGVTIRPGISGVLSSLGSGGWIFLRTLSLRAALLGTIVVATGHGTAVLAATQVLFSVFNLLALALDALAIAGQAMIGHALGAGRREHAGLILRRLIELSVLGGVVLGAVIAVASPWLGRVFTGDPDVLTTLPAGFLVLAIGLPIGGAVFALDGILIGAGDGRYLAAVGALNLVVVAPLLVLVGLLPLDDALAVAAIQGVFQVAYMLARLVTLAVRARSGRWAVVGAR